MAATRPGTILTITTLRGNLGEAFHIIRAVARASRRLDQLGPQQDAAIMEAAQHAHAAIVGIDRILKMYEKAPS